MEFESKLPKLAPNERYKYTIRANFCEDFLWVTGQNDSGIGKCVGTSMMYPKNFKISYPLWEKFSQWMRLFNMADKTFEEWRVFDLEGLALTIRLKRELGDKAVVQYLRSYHGLATTSVYGYMVNDDESLEAIY